MGLLDDFAASRPADVVRRGNAWYVDATAAPDLVAEATRRNVKVLGLEDSSSTMPERTRPSVGLLTSLPRFQTRQTAGR